MLVDVIIPFALRRTTVQGYLGLVLARHAFDAGVRRLAFLTVVRQIEVLDRIKELKDIYGDSNVAYFDKLTLLVGNTPDEIIKALKVE
jgi:hypothetical protein